MARKHYEEFRGQPFGLDDEDAEWLDNSAYPFRIQEKEGFPVGKTLLGVLGVGLAAAAARKLKRKPQAPAADGGVASTAVAAPEQPKGPASPAPALRPATHVMNTKGNEEFLKASASKTDAPVKLSVQPSPKASPPAVIYLPAKASPPPAAAAPAAKKTANRVRVAKKDSLKAALTGSAAPKVRTPGKKGQSLAEQIAADKAALQAQLKTQGAKPAPAPEAPSAPPPAPAAPAADNAAAVLRERLAKENAELAKQIAAMKKQASGPKAPTPPAPPAAAPAAPAKPIVIRRPKKTTADRVKEFATTKPEKPAPRAPSMEHVNAAAGTAEDVMSAAARIAVGTAEGRNPEQMASSYKVLHGSKDPVAKILSSRIDQASMVAHRPSISRENVMKVRESAQSVALAKYDSGVAAGKARTKGFAAAEALDLGEVFDEELTLAHEIRAAEPKRFTNATAVGRFAEDAVEQLRKRLPSTGPVGKLRRMLTLGLIAGGAASALRPKEKEQV